MMKWLIGIAMVLAITACATIPTAIPTPKGVLAGKTVLYWDEEDGFIYVPDQADPLRYSRAGMPSVQPGILRTDGGSIPRIFWSVKGLSPWAYGPAYVLHDFLFNEHRCGRLPAPPTGYSFEGANDVLYDAIAILVAQRKADGGALPLIKAGVDNFGRQAWEKDPCIATPPRPFSTARRRNAIKIVEFSF